MTEGTLYVVASPIGNLEDLSPRAREVLESVDLIAAEDTRHTGRLLSHFGITTRQFALHEHNEEQAAKLLVAKLRAGQSVALVSDAGTPLISDPGYRLIQAAHEHRVTVSPIPGASAVIAALSVAGLPTDRFFFEGFLPSKKPARRERLQRLVAERRTIVLFESVHRIADCLNDLVELFGPQRRAFIGRELTKLHEQCVSATLAELTRLTGDQQIPAKGEFVLIVEGCRERASPTVAVDLAQLLREFTAVMPGSQAVDVVAAITGRARNEIYRLMISQRGEDSGG